MIVCVGGETETNLGFLLLSGVAAFLGLPVPKSCHGDLLLIRMLGLGLDLFLVVFVCVVFFFFSLIIPFVNLCAALRLVLPLCLAGSLFLSAQQTYLSLLCLAVGCSAFS